MRIPVRMQREIARLHFNTRASSRNIACAVGSSRTTVQTMIRVLIKSETAWPELEAYDDDQWATTLGTNDKYSGHRKEVPDWTWVHTELSKKDVTLHLLWQEWREQVPTGIAYSQFTSKYGLWVGCQRLSMRQHHSPGDKLFVDFCGRVVRIQPKDGEPFDAAIFVAVLGASNYTFVLAVRSQTVKDWLKCIVATFDFIGGVPNWIVSDNLKAAVISRKANEVVINPTYQECLYHYDTAALPARPRRPKDKPKAEIGVQIAQRWILAALRNRIFTSLTELNREIQILLNALNERPFKKLLGCRRSRYEELDKLALKALPETPYEYAEWRFDVRVPEDYHVEQDRNFYSVPATLTHLLVDLRVTATIVEVFWKRQRMASHPRRAGQPSVPISVGHFASLQ